MFFDQMFLQWVFAIVWPITYSASVRLCIEMSPVMVIVVAFVFEFVLTDIAREWLFFRVLTHVAF